MDISQEILDSEVCLMPGELNKLLLLALVENKPKFVGLLIAHGANIESFLTYGRLYYIYNSITVCFFSSLK